MDAHGKNGICLRPTFNDAVKAMKEVLDPDSKILAAQDFRHTTRKRASQFQLPCVDSSA